MVALFASGTSIAVQTIGRLTGGFTAIAGQHISNRMKADPIITIQPLQSISVESSKPLGREKNSIWQTDTLYEIRCRASNLLS